MKVGEKSRENGPNLPLPIWEQIHVICGSSLTNQH